MSKRMTETTKWNDAWFVELPPTAKLFWLYSLDNCSLAGVFDVSYKMINFILESTDVDRDYINQHFSERVQWLNNNQFIINSFIKFQYKDGDLNPDYNPHKAVFKDLAKHSLTLNQVLTKSYVSLSEELQGKGKVQDKVMGKGKDKEEISKPREKKEPTESEQKAMKAFDDARKIYPGKRRSLKTEFDNMKKKHNNWRTECHDILTSCVFMSEYRTGYFKTGFEPHFQTFVNNRRWEEVLEEKRFSDEVGF